MSKGTEGHFDTLPIGRLGLIPLNSSAALGKKVDDYLVCEILHAGISG